MPRSLQCTPPFANFSFDQLPPQTRDAVHFPEPDVRDAARLAVASGFTIIGLSVTGQKREMRLKCRRTAAEILISTAKPNCEPETRYKLGKIGYRLPSKHAVKEQFAGIGP